MANEKSTERFGFAEKPELIRRNGKLDVRPGVRIGFTRCFTCNNMCGLRYRVDEATDTLTRVAGNPYCEVVTGGKPLVLDTPVAKAWALLTGDAGQQNRATCCGKGASGIDAVTDPRRVLTVLKRAGKRGENKWKTIPYEQAVREIVEGGNLFGEGHVEGLRAIRNLKTPAVPGQPEFGPKVNQLMATFNEEDTIRGSFYSRFMTKAFGTVNLTTKHAYCGAAVGVGYSVGLGPEIAAGMCDVDWDAFEYAVFIGTAPGASGASINRLGRAVADARVERKAKYVAVDPILRTVVANNTQGQWQPILPGTDTAFLYGVIRIILENKWMNSKFLVSPNEAAAKKAGEINWTNAAWLVDIKTQTMADAADFGCGKKGEGVVFTGGKPVSAATAVKGELFVDRTFRRQDGKNVRLVSSLELLRQQAVKYTLAEYAQKCGVPVERMTEIAREFTHHGRRVVAVSNTGNNSADAVMCGWLICILNSLAGSHDCKGGALYGNGFFTGFEGTYDLATVKGAPDQDGQMNACRNAPYEDSTEYKEHVKKGENPYPAKHIFHPLFPGYTAGNAAEMMVAMANKDPYPAKALFNWRSNVLFSASSIDHRIKDVLADPKQLPLFVGIDAFINETNMYADYIIPDRVMYEEYACDRTWGNYNQCVTAGVPVVTLRTVKNAKGAHVSMETFLVDCALAMKLPGFGKGAIPVKGGKPADLFTYDDWAVRYLSNAAEQFKGLPEVTDEDRRFAGLERAMKMVRPLLKPAEAARVEALLSRGGYYEADSRYAGEFMKNGGGKFLQFFNPAMPAVRHCFSGKPYPGVPVAEEARFFNGEAWRQRWSRKDYPLLFSSFKPILRSNYSVAFEHCTEISPENFVHMHRVTAQKFGLKNGDKVRIASPNGVDVKGVLMVDEAVTPGAVCVAHAYGHTAYGAENRVVDGKTVPGIAARAGGTAVNQMIPRDPTRPGRYGMLNDYWAACNCRTGIPVKVVKA